MSGYTMEDWIEPLGDDVKETLCMADGYAAGARRALDFLVEKGYIDEAYAYQARTEMHKAMEIEELIAVAGGQS